VIVLAHVYAVMEHMVSYIRKRRESPSVPVRPRTFVAVNIPVVCTGVGLNIFAVRRLNVLTQGAQRKAFYALVRVRVDACLADVVCHTVGVQHFILIYILTN
jgi:hypothetical protein